MSKKNKKIKITKQETQKKEKFNFVPWLIILGAIILVLAVFMVSDFLSDYHYVRKFSFDYSTGELLDKKNDITYIKAPNTYEPVRISNKPYATDGERDYYQIGFLSESGKEELIPTSVAIATSLDEGAYVYYNPKSLILPELDAFEASKVLICDMNNNTLQELDETETKILLDAIEESPDTNSIGRGLIFKLRLRSSKISWMSYCVYLYIAGDDFYIVDDKTDKQIKLPANACKLFDEDLLKLLGE